MCFWSELLWFSRQSHEQKTLFSSRADDHFLKKNYNFDFWRALLFSIWSKSSWLLRLKSLFERLFASNDKRMFFFWMMTDISMFLQIEIVTNRFSKFNIMLSEFMIFIFIKTLTFKSFIRWNFVFKWTIIELFSVLSNKNKFIITYSELSWILISIFLILMLNVNRRITISDKCLAKNDWFINDMKISLFMHNAWTKSFKVKIFLIITYWYELNANSWKFFFLRIDSITDVSDVITCAVFWIFENFSNLQFLKCLWNLLLK